MSTELVVILGGIGVVALAWLLLRFGKQLARFVLVLLVLAAVGIGLSALATQGAANFQTAGVAKEAAEAAKAASIGQTVMVVGAGLLVGALLTTLVLALGAGGYLWIRWKLAERRLSLSVGEQGNPWLQSPTGGQRRRQLPQGEPVVYWVSADNEETDLVDVDLAGWGWE